MKVNVKKLCERIIVCLIIASIGLMPVSAEARTDTNEILIYESDTSTDQSEKSDSETADHNEPPEINDETENEQPVNEVFTYDGYQYTLENDEVTIIKQSSTLSEDTVPSEINGYPVVAIGAYAFSGAYLDNGFTIPESVKVIEDNAFENAQINGGLFIFQSLEEIGKDAFKGATIDEVFFMGSKSKFKDINIGAGNEILLNTKLNDKFNISWLMFKSAFSAGVDGLIEFPAYVLMSLGGPILFLFPPLGLIGFALTLAPVSIVADTVLTSWSYFEAAIAVLFI